MDKLSVSLSYQFKNQSLLKQALTHCSAGKENNERLEFLGDAILGLVISELLYLSWPSASEGELSRIRASLVQQSTLASLARSLNLGEHLKLGPGELKTGGANRDSILADAVEALISAIFLDGGMQVCKELVALWFAPYLNEQQQILPVKDAKTSLQEFLQARKLALPLYEIVDIKGQDHQQEFVVQCSVVLLQNPVIGIGTSRKEAEQLAAAEVLSHLDVKKL